MPYGPQTLQDLCFLKVANELDSFSPDAIFAQLPPTQRTMLLLRLPLIDVIKLEGTSVVRGIDMNMVWEKLCNQRLEVLDFIKYPFERSAFHLEGSWKSYYLAIAASIILNPFDSYNSLYYSCCDFFFNLLFSYLPGYTVIIPDRYDSLEINHLESLKESQLECASFLMEECNFRPKVVYISFSLFFRSQFYDERRESVEANTTLREFLSSTQEIVFTSDDKVMKHFTVDENYDFIEDTCRGSYNFICEHVLDMILRSREPKLESVYTDDKCPDWLIDPIICAISGFFGAKKSVWKKNVLAYKHLKKIGISVDGLNDIPVNEYNFRRAVKGLTSAIEAQTSLEVLRLNRWPCNEFISTQPSHIKHLFSVLVPLLTQPQFWSLELKATSFPFITLQDILRTFFTPSSPNHQTLKLESVAIIQKKDEMPDTFVMPDSNETLLTGKSLHMSDMELTPSLETLIFTYPLLKLDSLALVNLTSAPSKSLEKAADHLRMNNMSNLKTLILKDIVFHHPHPQTIVSLLLQSPHLHHLELEHVDIGPGGLVMSLPHEISHHSELRVLKLVRLDLERQSERVFQQLCVAILSLPHVSSLSLDLSTNELTLHHVTVILDTWKQTCSGKKLKELILSGNDLEPGLLPLANIAEYVVC